MIKVSKSNSTTAKVVFELAGDNLIDEDNKVLQLNNIVKSLFSQPIFDLGYGPALTVDTVIGADVKDPRYNLRYNRTADLRSNGMNTDNITTKGSQHTTWESYGEEVVDALGYLPVDTLDKDRDPTYTEDNPDYTNPVPKVNGIMLEMGQRIIPTRPTGRITTENGHNINTEDGGHITTE